jgi:hypothetical protein
MQIEARWWREGIRSGKVECGCRKLGYPINEHRGVAPHRSSQLCAWVYAVGRVYELERRLVSPMIKTR